MLQCQHTQIVEARKMVYRKPITSDARLHSLYEMARGKSVAYETWQDVKCYLRKAGLEINQENLSMYGTFKQLANQSAASPNEYLSILATFNRYYELLPSMIKGNDFRERLENSDIFVSDRTWFRWFKTDGLTYSKNTYYEKSKLLNVLFKSVVWKFKHLKEKSKLKQLN